MQRLFDSLELPDFILKSTLGVSMVSVLLITPFSVNNFIQGRVLLGVLSLGIVVLFAIDGILCLRGRYHKGVNLFVVAPILILTIASVMYQIGVAGSYWAYLGVLSFYFILPKTAAWKINVFFLLIIYPIAWNSMDASIAIRFGAVLAGVSVYAYTVMSEISKQHLLLKEKSITDALTGLYNRSMLQKSLEYIVHQRNRSNTPMALLMLDLDNFKIINDEFGHGTGDSVLKAVGTFLRENFRGSDMVFRIGGEEFLAIIHNTDEPSAIAIAEKIRAGIEQLPIIADRPITTSIGMTCLQPNTSWEEWMKICDDNLYRAKSNGRNQVITHC